MEGAQSLAGPDISWTEDDLMYEEELLRNPFSIKLWLRFLQAKHLAAPAHRNLMFERALHALPGSYKLWLMYLRERKNRAVQLSIDDGGVEALNNAFERSLIWMHKMPRIWLDYLSFLMHQKKVTKTRHTFDRALRSLPATQHEKIWKLYLTFARNCNVPETTCRIYRRYIKFNPDMCEDYIDTLLTMERWDEAAATLALALNRDNFVSKRGKSKHDMWLDMCELITTHAPHITSIKVDAVMRAALRRFSEETGRLWTALADYYIRLGQFDKARDIFEEATSTVMTVRDFSVVYEAQTTFEESMVTAKMEMQEEEGGGALEDDDEIDPEAFDLDLRMARLEMLIERRPELLSSVLLRQNPNNVGEWHKRVKLFEADPAKVIQTYAEAVKTVDPKTTAGRAHTLWCAFAKYYEENDDLDSARLIFDKATKVDFRTVEDLALVWCEWIEMELRHHEHARALTLAKRAVAGAPKRFLKGGGDAQWRAEGTTQERLWQSSKVWSLLADLSESLQPLDETRAIYDRMCDLRVCTPQIILNYAHLLEENAFFEESFRVYEKGVGLFPFPAVVNVWSTYLAKFLERYKGTKCERMRDLFEQVIKKAPNKDCTTFYLMYAKFEEEYGMIKKAMAVYDRATQAVKQEDRLTVFQLYITKAATHYGATKTRPIYEAAISALPDEHVRIICQQYINLELKLGEIDRARALYVYAAQYSDPNVTGDYWQAWHEFEVKHGNEDTFREMLRIKRSAQLEYAQKRMMTSNVTDIVATGGTAFKSDEMAKLEMEVRAAHMGLASSSSSATLALPPPSIAAAETSAPAAANSGVVEENPDEIDIDMADDAAPAAKPITYQQLNFGLEEKPVPDAVFGGIKRKAELAAEQEGGGALGAKERFLKAKGNKQ